MTKKSNIFDWFYIGYAHRSVVWKYVFPLNVLNKKRKYYHWFVRDCSNYINYFPQNIKKSLIRQNKLSQMNFLPGASLPVLARGCSILEVNSLRTVRLSTALLLFKNSLDVADEVGLFTVLPFFQRKLDRTRPSSPPPPHPPPPSPGILPGLFQMRNPGHTCRFS